MADTKSAQTSAQQLVDYRTAIVKKYPEQVIVAIAKDKNGKPNPMTMGWTMITSGSPPMMAISMGHTRYTNAAIKHSGCFTIAFPSAEQADHVLFFGRNSGRNVDKFAETGCRNTPAEVIDSVLLTDAVANFECQLEDQFITGDHTIFVGRIVASHINTQPKRRLYIIGPGAQLGPVKTGV
jgi:flavin reductase (DIM6/NTAB) family NADH-FMN oxidoreductase RutF